MVGDPGLQLELSLRLLVAAGLGAAIGIEREIHHQPAGVRTHLLVALGSGVFTILSIHGFRGFAEQADAEGLGVVYDPSRVAAQIVSGIGFLGAGAILRQGGLSIRGLTTAGSLWATAALGMAAGAGQLILALIGAAVVLFSLWPLRRMVRSVTGTAQGQVIDLRIEVGSPELVGIVATHLTENRFEIQTMETGKLGKGRFELAIGGRVMPPTDADLLVNTLSSLSGVDRVEIS